MTDRNPCILVVEDDPTLRDALCDTLEVAGYAVTSAADGPAALELCERSAFDVVVSDVQMRPMDGHELLARIRGRRPDLPVVLMTAHGTIGKAVEAMRDGAADYLAKPFEASTLIDLVQRLLPRDADSTDLVAEDPRMREVLAMARRIATTDVTVLITGESGTGKEVFARFLHGESNRRERAFVAINCAAIPENMLEAVLFGHEKGAFTGAQNAHAGKFEQAQGGTLLLDEVSEMDLNLQAKLLRVLQEREVERLGGTRTIALDVRVLATSNRSLREEVAAGRFREDLFYRLNVVPLRLPSLRERPADILPLARRALARHTQPGAATPALSAAAEERLLAHDWPGNVRELDNLMQRAAILAVGATLAPEDLRFESSGAPHPGPLPADAGRGSGAPHPGPLPADAGRGSGAPHPAETLTPALSQLSSGEGVEAPLLDSNLRERERALIREALQSTSSRKEAAARLGISPRTLRHKLAQMRARGVEVA